MLTGRTGVNINSESGYTIVMFLVLIGFLLYIGTPMANSWRNYVPPSDEIESMRPRLSMPVKYEYVSSEFGMRYHPVYKIMSRHTGIDLAATRGTLVMSCMAGKVVYAGWKSGYGKLVVIEHEDGYRSYYGHLSEILAKKNQEVTRYELIGKVGSTGTSTGNHLHFEIRSDGIPVNPKYYLEF